MADRYTGWKLFNKIAIVTKPISSYNYKTGQREFSGEYQGYIVDIANKKQLQSAREWGATFEYVYEEGTNKIIETIKHAPAEYIYENKDFTLELCDAAEGSSQGGKLSFWNCWVTASDGKRFLIGIAANLLLDVLKSTTVINGVVQEKLMFARCRGGVGMLSPNMNSYKDATKDAAIKKKMSTGKTSKHRVGYVYETTTQSNIYAGDFYKWYEPIYGEKQASYYPYHTFHQLLGFRKLDKPIVLKWFPDYHEDEYEDYYVSRFGSWQLHEKLPARKESIKVDNIPDLQKCVDSIETNYESRYNAYMEAKSKGLNMSHYIDDNSIGLSVSKNEYTMPDTIRKLLVELGYFVE